MPKAIKRKDLAELGNRLPGGELKSWCDLSAAGPAEQIVYVDGEMLSRCRASANVTDESTESSTKNENVSGQHGGTVEHQAELGDGSQLHEQLGLDLCVHSHLLRVISSLTDRMAFVFLLCEEQAKKRGVDADEFEERIQGRIHNASVAFCEELASFFQRSGEPELIALQRLVVKHIECMKNGRKSISELIESGRYDSQLEEAVAKGQQELHQKMSGEL